VEHIDSFNDAELEDQLEKYVAEIINSRVVVDTVQGELTLPRCLHAYYADFTKGVNNDEALLKFVFKYYTLGEISEEKAIKDVCYKKTMIIRYD
jgi:hypothetical protein